MKNFKKSFIYLLLIFGFYPFTSSAIGQITSPINISDALPSESYEEELMIIGERTASSSIALSASGEVSDWITFYKPENLNLAINSIQLAAGESAKVIAKIMIPANASLGKHSGIVSVALGTGKNEINNQSGAYVTQKIDRDVNINVSSEEKINFNVSIIPETYDLALGEPLNIRIIYDNQGNTNIAPDIHLKMQNGDQVVYSVIFPYPDNTPETKPGSQFEIKSLQIPSTGLERGKYTVNLDFYNNSTLSLQKDFSFSLRTPAEKQSLLAGFFSQLNKQIPLFFLLGIALLFALLVMVRGANFFKEKKKSVKLFEK
ncbi:MAG: hypothetical protein WC467_01765 [Patescibacteria group bacterium]